MLTTQIRPPLVSSHLLGKESSPVCSPSTTTSGASPGFHPDPRGGDTQPPPHPAPGLGIPWPLQPRGMSDGRGAIITPSVSPPGWGRGSGELSAQRRGSWLYKQPLRGEEKLEDRRDRAACHSCCVWPPQARTSRDPPAPSQQPPPRRQGLTWPQVPPEALASPARG